MRPRLSPPVLIALALPLLLAVVVAALGITARVRGDAGPAAVAPETGPLALVPVDAPDAAGPGCAALLAALPATLPGAGAPRPLADPAPSGARAWAAAPRPVVLRCGLTRPAELAPDSALLAVDGVEWLRLADPAPNPELVSYVAVDRPVYVVLTLPPGTGSGPLQAVADAIRATLPAVPVAVR